MVVVFGILMALAFVSGAYRSGKKRKRRAEAVMDVLRAIRNIATRNDLFRVSHDSFGEWQNPMKVSGAVERKRVRIVLLGVKTQQD